MTKEDIQEYFNGLTRVIAGMLGMNEYQTDSIDQLRAGIKVLSSEILDELDSFFTIYEGWYQCTQENRKQINNNGLSSEQINAKILERDKARENLKAIVKRVIEDLNAYEYENEFNNINESQKKIEEKVDNLHSNAQINKVKSHKKRVSRILCK